MFKLFNEIINGNLQPHLFDDENISSLIELLKSNHYHYDQDEYQKFNDFVNEYFERERKYYFKEVNAHGKIININNKGSKWISGLALYVFLDQQVAFQRKAKLIFYSFLIIKELKLIKDKLNSFVVNSTEVKSNELFALKNIHRLKELAQNIRIYNNKLERLGANYFVIQILEWNIIELIHYLQKTFSIFGNLKVESKASLFHDLFSFPKRPRPEDIIFPLLPSEKDFDDFKIEFRKKSDKEVKRDGSGISIGENLFKFYKSKYKDLSNDSQIENYYMELKIWNELLIMNELKTVDIDTYINEPEIEKIFIPLLELEINFLQKGSKNQTISLSNNSLPISTKSFKRVPISALDEFYEFLNEFFGTSYNESGFKINGQCSEPPKSQNPLIFNEAFLNSFYAVFNDFLWKNAEIEHFKNWFRRKPDGAPDFKDDMQTYFCYVLGLIEKKRDKSLCPNFQIWIKPLINNCNYYSLKSRKENTKNPIIQEIDDKFSLLPSI